MINIDVLTIISSVFLSFFAVLWTLNKFLRLINRS